MVRDGLLGGTLAAGLVLSVVLDSDVWVLPFAAMIALLGAVARQLAGQAPISRARLWRVAIGLAMLAATVAAMLVSR